jgi:acyl-CoA synthetase (NDP forming)
MSATPSAIGAQLETLRRGGRRAVVEPEGFPLLQAAGLATPRLLVLESSRDPRLADVAAFPGARVVVKVASERFLHRSDVGGVAVVEKSVSAVSGAIAGMEARLEAAGRRFVVAEYVAYDRRLGGELLLGLRWTEDFGAVVSVAAGGIHTEFLARSFRQDESLAIFPVGETRREAIERRLTALPLVRLLTESMRGQAPRLPLSALVTAVEACQRLGRELCPWPVQELEVNPLVATPTGLVALDVLVSLGDAPTARPAPRPLAKIAQLLAPRRVALVGVSESMNPGRIILENLLREGFPREAITIVKPGVESVAGCAAVPDLDSLPAPVDLLVLAVAAGQIPALIESACEGQRAESIVVIPGGLEEKQGTREMLAPMYGALAASRGTAWGGPVVNGGNCLGVRSVPGRIDTLFIPPHKMPPRDGPVSPVAVISQSGAFAVARAGKLPGVRPKYLVTVGNQMDLTVGDYLTHLAGDATLELFAVYVEGFRPLDGLAMLSAARRIVARGGTVVLYRAGRTAAGAAASASHTASVAGDAAVMRELARQAGVVVAESLEEFEDLVTTFAALAGKTPRGVRLGAVSNAGFECVALADSLGALALAAISPPTRERIQALLDRARLGGLVDVHNPLDLTPMAGDATFAEAARLVLDDDGVDVGVVGCVPLTAALQTLPRQEGHQEDLDAAGGVVTRLCALASTSATPWVAVVDAGDQYDPMVRRLRSGGVPTFRSIDRAMSVLNRWVAAKRGQPAAAPAVASGSVVGDARDLRP